MNAVVWPAVIDVRVRARGSYSRGIHIWFPFFILWPLLLVLAGFVLLITALVDLALWASGARYHHYTLFVLSSMRLLSEARGTHARIDSASNLITVDIH